MLMVMKVTAGELWGDCAGQGAPGESGETVVGQAAGQHAQARAKPRP